LRPKNKAFIGGYIQPAELWNFSQSFNTIKSCCVTWLPHHYRKLGVEEAARQEIETREATAKEKVSLAEEERAKER